MTSIEMRDNPLFMRNGFETVGKWNIPLVKKQNLDLTDIQFVACSDTRANDNETNKKRGVHFFVDDFRFEGIYNNPERTLDKYSQYAFLLTPDFSLYADMPLWKQLENVAKNRWVGAYWQSKGLKVIPTIAWSTARSFDFCFDGIEKNSIIAIGMIGCKRNKLSFMRGYNAMLEKLHPEAIIVLGLLSPKCKEISSLSTIWNQERWRDNMGGRGSSSGVSISGKQYGTEYKSFLTDGNVKFVIRLDGNPSAPMETMTKNRVYVTIDANGNPKYISYYDKDNMRKKQIDLTVPHNFVFPHTHHGYHHNENDTEKGFANPNTKEKAMVERIQKSWYSKGYQRWKIWKQSQGV